MEMFLSSPKLVSFCKHIYRTSTSFVSKIIKINNLDSRGKILKINILFYLG